jgi:hypothetical protein
MGKQHVDLCTYMCGGEYEKDEQERMLQNTQTFQLYYPLSLE